MQRLIAWTIGLSLALVGLAALCSFLGARLSTEGQWIIALDVDVASDIWKLRLFRIAVAAVVGASLAVAGVALQALLRNPLAEPYILGLSSGAGVGVLFVEIAGLGAVLHTVLAAPAFAFLGAIATTFIVYALAHRHGRLDPFVLLLSGVIVNVFNGALVLVMLQLVRTEEVMRYIGWGMGHIPEWIWFRPLLLVAGAIALVLSLAWLLGRGAAFNALTLGDDIAESTGVAVARLRLETFIAASLLTAAAVALAGPIGFVGLIVPHACRIAIGPDHRLLLVVSALVGAIFLVVADNVCRVVSPLLTTGSLPVGVITAIIGGPTFIVLLRHRFAKGGAA